jgi:hypothetical protein
MRGVVYFSLFNVGQAQYIGCIHTGFRPCRDLSQVLQFRRGQGTGFFEKGLRAGSLAAAAVYLQAKTHISRLRGHAVFYSRCCGRYAYSRLDCQMLCLGNNISCASHFMRTDLLPFYMQGSDYRDKHPFGMHNNTFHLGNNILDFRSRARLARYTRRNQPPACNAVYLHADSQQRVGYGACRPAARRGRGHMPYCSTNYTLRVAPVFSPICFVAESLSYHQYARLRRRAYWRKSSVL